jgi:peptide/nickel transport system substrate-binding protein
MQRNKTSAIVTMVAALLLVFFYASCSRQGSRTSSQSPVTELRYGFMSEPATLDPLNSSNTADGRALLFNVFEGLVKPNIDGRILPCLAELQTMDETGRVYHFTLRKNVRFHDGSLLTSSDVKFSLDTALSAGFIGFSEIEKIETDGDYAIRVTLKKSDPEFLPYLTVGIVKADSTDRDKIAIGTGPYIIEDYTVQQSLTLKRFKGYWQDNVIWNKERRLEKVTIVFYADTDALLLGLHGGSIDGAGITGALVHQLKAKRFDIVHGYSSMVQLLALNNAVAPFNDIRVRQAVNFGVDIQEIIDTAFYGEGKPSGSPIMPGLSVYYDQSLVNPYPADPEKARALLSEAGYGEDGQKLSLEITVPSNFVMHVDTAQVIVAQLEKIGINASIKLVDWATWLSDVYFGRKYQATIISLDSPIVSPKGFLSRYESGDNSNFINYANADFDQVFSAILAETNEYKRITLYKEAQRIISADAASVYIQDIAVFKAFPAGVYSGILNYPLYVIDFASMYVK